MSSKEQTPITAWEFYENSDTANVYEVMEQYAQAKVLEAIEPTIETLQGWLQDLNEGHYLKPYRLEDEIEYLKNYIETEVKPKYE